MRDLRLIAIVDDDQPFRDSMKRLMVSLGYSVEAFPSAENFLASPSLSETACLIADVNMPGMTGPELHRHLLDAGRAIPSILVTAYPDDRIRNGALRQGVLCFLYKPVDDQDLEECVRSALHEP
ncbi:MAG: response regulator [Alphaproteobacteria bacterium]|nr:response regulator [Alphaproteobacteria bacterium]MBV8407901.1 response regulator [Alphaproteobacteria bacterium]